MARSVPAAGSAWTRSRPLTGRALALSLGITGCRVVGMEGGSSQVRHRHKVTQLVVSG